MRVLVVGPVPPPHGGVAVFVERLVRALRHRRLDVRHLNPLAWEKRGPWGRLRKAVALVSMFFSRADVVHDNVGPYFWQSALGRRLYAMGLALSGKPVVVNVHQGRFPEVYASLTPSARQTIRSILGRLRLVISDNTSIRDFLLAEGVPPERVRVLPSFVPFEDAGGGTVPAGIDRFVRERSPLLAVSAYTYSPVYNLDAVLRLMQQLRERFPNLGLLLFVSRFVLDPGYKARILALRDELDLGSHVIEVSDLPDVLQLFRRCDVLLRSTQTDGSSLSVLEALYVGTPVVATDCAERPPGTILFPTGDWEAAYQQLARLLEAPPERRPEPRVRDEAERNLDAIVDSYHAAVGEPGR